MHEIQFCTLRFLSRCGFRFYPRVLANSALTPYVFLLFSLFIPLDLASLSFSSFAHAQISPSQEVSPPRAEPLFNEDARDEKVLKKQNLGAVMRRDQPPNSEVNFDASEVQFDRDSNIVKGSKGVLISGNGLQAQAEQGSLNLTTKDAKLEGQVVISDANGRVLAEHAELNVESETGSFSNTRFELEETGFVVNAEKAKRLSETEYEITDGRLTTCQCDSENGDDESVPWQIKTGRCHITQEGYAHAYDSSLEMFGVPVFYTPYFGFPAKSERTSGLLAPSVGYSDTEGMLLHLPTFIVIDESTDMTVTPFLESKSRVGSAVEFRKEFSRESNLKSRVIYSNESLRGDDLQGTVPSGYDFTKDDTPWDTNRFGGFLSQGWRSEPGAEWGSSLVSDIHLVSDDLFLREIDDSEIGSRQSQYTTSSVAGSTSFGEMGSLTVRGEFNQSFEIDDDLVLQRLPEAKFQTSRTYRPFGVNQLGFKLTPKLAVSTTDFVRRDGYDGFRTDLAPSVTAPIRYKNYFQSAASVGTNQTYYNLSETVDPSTGEKLDGNQTRTVPTFSYSIGTGVERVFELAPDSWLTEIAGLGKDNRDVKLARMKHKIEPFISYLYVPKVSQGDLPLFDSFDRVRERSSVTYGFTTTLLGRLVTNTVTSQEIPELAPRIEDLPAFAVDQPFEDLGLTAADPTFANVSAREGQIRRLAVLRVRQNYDYFDDEANSQREEGEPEIRAFSDVGVDIGIFPSNYFGLLIATNINQEDSEFSSWNMVASLRTDRGDALRSRVSYVNDSVSQIEGNLEVVLTHRVRAAYYTRYDELESEFIENRVGLRVRSDCDCWYFDVGVVDTINPDQQSVMASFTFAGLGSVGQGFMLGQNDASQ